MKFFKMYAKVIRYSFRQTYRIIIVYTLFLFVSVPFVGNINQEVSDSQKVSIIFINEDSNNTLINNMRAYLSGYCNFEIMSEDKDSVADALYFEKAQCMVKVPQGFSEKMIQGEAPKLELKTINSEKMEAIVMQAVNQYLNVVEHQNIQTEADLDYAADFALEKVSQKSEFTLYANNVIDKTQLTYLFNLLGYVILCSTVAIISLTIFQLRQGRLLNKIKISPISKETFRVQILLSSIVFLLLFTTILIICGLFLFGKQGINISTVFMIINSYVFILYALSFALLIGVCMKSMRHLIVLLNVTTLTMCFLGGAILEKQNMTPLMKEIGTLFPVYWYVKNNIQISSVSTINLDVSIQFISHLGILLLFSMINIVVGCIVVDKEINLER